jgi:hypothetical protein
MERLVPAMMAAWRAAERSLVDSPSGPKRRAASLNASTCCRAYSMATSGEVDRETVVRFLEEQGLGDIVTPPAGPQTAEA